MRHGLLAETVHLFVIFYSLSFSGCETEDVRALKHVAVGFLDCKIGTGLLKRREVYLAVKKQSSLYVSCIFLTTMQNAIFLRLFCSYQW